MRDQAGSAGALLSFENLLISDSTAMTIQACPRRRLRFAVQAKLNPAQILVNWF